MTAADVPRVMEIAASLPEAPQWPESAYLDALNPESMPRRIALVAAGPQPGQVAGFIVASLLPPHAELESIAVAAGSQGQGLGRMLFDSLVNELIQAGVHEIVLEVRASNHPRWLSTAPRASAKSAFAGLTTLILLKMRCSCG